MTRGWREEYKSSLLKINNVLSLISLIITEEATRGQREAVIRIWSRKCARGPWDSIGEGKGRSLFKPPSKLWTGVRNWARDTGGGGGDDNHGLFQVIPRSSAPVERAVPGPRRDDFGGPQRLPNHNEWGRVISFPWKWFSQGHHAKHSGPVNRTVMLLQPSKGNLLSLILISYKTQEPRFEFQINNENVFGISVL